MSIEERRIDRSEELAKTSEEAVERVVHSLSQSFYNAGPFSGFSAIGLQEIKDHLSELVGLVKKEIREEIKNHEH